MTAVTEDELLRQLGELRDVHAPAGVRAGALLGAGLADAYFPLDAPIGRVYVAHNAQGLSAVSAADSPEEFERTYLAETGRVAVRQQPAERLAQTLQEWLRGDRRHALRFDLRGLGAFQQAVLFKALDIPYGQVRPYSWIAREIGRPKAVRAVGTALAHNPIPLFIPCHRVVRSDGHLGQYSLIGPDAKRVVLAAEGVQLDHLEALASAGVRYLGSDTTHVFCFPTCRHTEAQPHQVRFASETQARAAGYQPCASCKPSV